MYARGDGGWREVVTSRTSNSGGAGGSSAVDRLAELLGGLGGLVDDFVRDGGGAASVLPPALCHPPTEQRSAGRDGDDGSRADGDDSCADEDASEDSAGAGDGEDASGADDATRSSADDPPVSGIVVDVDGFEGPPAWSSWRKPPGGRLVRNPLACLIPMSDITRPLSCGGRRGGDDDGGGDEGGRPRPSAELYVLNANYGGNEMYDSNLRVILETSDERTKALVRECIELDTAGSMGDWLKLEARAESIPACLFYYGYFSWSSTAA